MAKKIKEEVFKKPEGEFGEKVSYQEWECKILNGTVEKLKIRRPNVKITEDQAAILNEGVLRGSNTYGVLYYLPE